MNKYLLKYLFYTSNIIFALLIITISYHNRIATDDFHFLDNILNYGIIKGVVIEYNTWSTRWLSVLINHVVLRFILINKISLFIFNIISITLFIIAVYVNVNKFKGIVKTEKISSFDVLNISVFIVSAVFYTTIGIGETWFWLCSSCTYLYSVTMLLFANYWLFNKNSNVLIGIISFFFIGCTLEPLAILIILTLILIFAYNYIKKQELIQNKKIIIAIVLCSIAFLTLYGGKGTCNRELFFKKITIFESLILNFQLMKIIIHQYLIKLIPYIFIFSTPFIFLGQNSKNKIDVKKWLIYSSILVVLFFVIFYLYQLSITYKTQDISAIRALFPVTFVLLITSFTLFYLLGSLIFLIKKTIISTYIAVVIIIILSSYNLITQSKILEKYTYCYDKRIEYLEANKNNTKTIILKPLPYSGYLYSAEISTDSTYFSNQHLKKALRLKGDIVLEKE